MKRALARGLLGSLLSVASPSFAHEPPEGAQPAEVSASPEQARRAASIARQTMSPFCPGRTLADCPSNYAAEWRDDIRSMVARGLSDDEIQRELFGRAGGDLSGIPNREVSYVVPLLWGAAALSLLGWLLWRLRARQRSPGAVPGEPAAAAPAEPGSVDDQRLAAELAAEDDD